MDKFQVRCRAAPRPQIKWPAATFPRPVSIHVVAPGPRRLSAAMGCHQRHPWLRHHDEHRGQDQGTGPLDAELPSRYTGLRWLVRLRDTRRRDRTVGLTTIWVRTLSDGLIRADHIVGIDAHRTPPLAGKHAHWLLDVVLPAPVGSGRGEVWDVSALHRTLLQTTEEPVEAPMSLASLLAQLDAMDTAGVIVPTMAPVPKDPSRKLPQFSFVPFPTTTDPSL